jgi:hypothetical protein
VHHQALESFYPLQAATTAAAPLDAQGLLAQLAQLLGSHIESVGPSLQEAANEQVRSPMSEERGRDIRNRSVALDHWAAQAYAERRLRDKVFNDPEIFGEPAWDALLDIASAEARGERLAVTSACIGSCAPSTTALRWLKTLEERRLVRREPDPGDARRSFLRLTDEGRKKVEAYFQEVSRLRAA